MKDRNRSGGHAHVELFTPELVRDAVIVPIYLDMVIDTHGRFFPLGVLVGMGRQLGQRRFVDGFKKVSAGVLHLLQGPLIEHDQLFSNGPVQLCQREETMVSQLVS